VCGVRRGENGNQRQGKEMEGETETDLLFDVSVEAVEARGDATEKARGGNGSVKEEGVLAPGHGLGERIGLLRGRS
jgi:hypothetical protein